MKNSTKFIILIFILFIFYFFFVNKLEKFNCMNCHRNSVWSNPFSLIERQCRNCENCGVCVDRNGNRRCKIGNYSGPLFASDCYRWYHGPRRREWASLHRHPRRFFPQWIF